MVRCVGPQRAGLDRSAHAGSFLLALVDGVMRPLTFTAFQNRRLLFERVVDISSEQLGKYVIGAVVEN